jgi:hypothetical protein
MKAFSSRYTRMAFRASKNLVVAKFARNKVFFCEAFSYAASGRGSAVKQNACLSGRLAHEKTDELLQKVAILRLGCRVFDLELFSVNIRIAS